MADAENDPDKLQKLKERSISLAERATKQRQVNEKALAWSFLFTVLAAVTFLISAWWPIGSALTSAVATWISAVAAWIGSLHAA
jgi:hypothetical protein